MFISPPGCSADGKPSALKGACAVPVAWVELTGEAWGEEGSTPRRVLTKVDLPTPLLGKKKKGENIERWMDIER